jgi:hypothetical protein
MQADFLERQLTIWVIENPFPGDGGVEQAPPEGAWAGGPAPAGSLDGQPATQVYCVRQHGRQEARPVFLRVVAENSLV